MMERHVTHHVMLDVVELGGVPSKRSGQSGYRLMSPPYDFPIAAQMVVTVAPGMDVPMASQSMDLVNARLVAYALVHTTNVEGLRDLLEGEGWTR